MPLNEWMNENAQSEVLWIIMSSFASSTRHVDQFTWFLLIVDCCCCCCCYCHCRCSLLVDGSFWIQVLLFSRAFSSICAQSNGINYETADDHHHQMLLLLLSVSLWSDQVTSESKGINEPNEDKRQMANNTRSIHYYGSRTKRFIDEITSLKWKQNG